MDSSRFWLKFDYEEQFARYRRDGTPVEPTSFSKEFARGFSKGTEGYNDDQRAQIAVRYIEGIQNLLSTEFEPDIHDWEVRVRSGIGTIIERLIN
mgnify:CR=1 FL=1